jgi:outer membrane autotransporter protein
VTSPPTATEIAQVNNGPTVNIKAGAAAAKELLIGATINSGVITPSGAGAVIVDGPNASLILGNGFGGSQDSLEVVNGLLVVENGATLSAQSGTIGALGQMLFTNGGSGFFSGNLVNNGIIKPGTLTVSGNYTQSATGTLRIEVAGTAPGQFDQLQVGGHVSLAGTLQLIGLGSFRLQAGDKLTFLSAKGGVSGTFSTIENNFLTGTVVKGQILVLPNAVVLEGTQGSFVPEACNPNSVAVAQALDNVAGDPRAAALISFLNSEPVGRLCSDFTLIAPEQLASIFNIGVSLANVQSANLERQMDDIRAGSTGFNSAGFSMNGAPSYGGGLGGPTGPEGKSGPSVLAPIPENRWGVFVSGLGEFTHVDSTDTARGFDLQTGGVTFGVDYRIGSNFAIGLMAGYAHTNADLANSGDIDVNSGKFGLYATAFTGGFYLDSAVTGGLSGYDTRRTALLGTASGSTNGGDLNVLVNGGYDWKEGSLSIGPTASFQYTYVSFDGFTESGSLAPLKFNDQQVDSIRTAFGMKASYDWKIGNVLIRPKLRATWQHEYSNSAYSIVASFANGAGSSFTATSPKIGRDSLLLEAGFAVQWSDRISTYIYYDGELGRTNYQSNSVSAGIRVTF